MAAINGTTKLHGILGDPVSHSLSPAMHNAAFAELGLNSVYLPLQTKNVREAIIGLKALGFAGASVTIPHKQAVIPCLDFIDPVAEKIGAVNTLLFKEGSVHGANTDWIGANQAIEQTTKLPKKKVLILGAGGSARALGFGLLEAGAQVSITNRTQGKGQELADLLHAPFVPASDLGGIEADILVNTTSVGMTPHIEATPMPRKYLRHFSVVMDIVYAPQRTRLLTEAEEEGCKTINGLAMLLFQGTAQFELWTGQKAPVEVMRRHLLAGLKPQTSKPK